MTAAPRTTAPDKSPRPGLSGESGTKGGDRRGRITPAELRRRLWHMAPGLLPFLLWPFPHRDPISPTLYGIMVGLGVLLALGIFTGYRRIERAGERNQRLPAVAGYAGSVLAMFLLFPGHAELGLTVLGVLAFGDGSATLIGMLAPRHPLPWNPQKTMAGLAAFVLVGGLMASLIYWGETHNLEADNPPVAFPVALVCGMSAALAAAAVESLRWRINDNIRVGIAAALALVVAHGFVVGWW